MTFADEIDGPVVAIGDIHGERGQLDALLGRLAADGWLAGRWVVFLGDYNAGLQFGHGFGPWITGY